MYSQNVRVLSRIEEYKPLVRHIVEMSLFCVVLTHPLPEPFPVNISKENWISEYETISKEKLTFGHLKMMILREVKSNPVYMNVHGVKSLWKVKGLAEGNNKWTNLEETAKEDETDVEQKLRELGGDKLISTMKVEAVFQDPYDDGIHIIVQPPPQATTGKKRREDSGSDEEGRTRKKERHAPKTLASLLTSSTLQPFPSNIPPHKFYDREQALKLMLDVARSNFQGRKSLDHKNHNFLLIPGGIGIGKTRMGWESKYLSSNLVGGNDDNDDFVEAMKNPCYNFIDLNNGSKYIDGFDDKEDASVRIGARIALSSGLVSDSRLSTLVMDTNIGLFSFSNVICEILKRHFIKNRCPLAIIIHIDEYQVYINDIQQHQQLSWKKSRDFFKSMLRAIGSVMRGNNIEREYNGKYFIIPICTGTSAIDIHFLPTEHKQEILELRPLNYASAKSMFLDKYYYSSGIANKDDVVRGLKNHFINIDFQDYTDEKFDNLSKELCKFVLDQQHFRIAMFDTGFIPKFIDDLLGPSTLKSDFDWGNQLLTKISGRNIGNWKEEFSDMRIVISFGLTRQPIKRDFRLTSGLSIGELERSGLIYLSNTKGEWYIIVMPFMLLKVLNNQLLVSNVVEPVFQDNLLLIPTYDSPWQWQNFESLYGHYQKAIIDSLIYIQEAKINSIKYKINELELEQKKQEEICEIAKINRKIDLKKQELNNQINNYWQLSDIFRGVKGADTLLQRRVQLRQLKVFIEKEKFLQLTDDIAKFDKSVLCDDNVIRPFNGGVFRCYQGCANIDHRWAFDSADSGKNLAIFSQIKYSERDSTTELSTPAIKRWYDTTMESVKNYKNDYDVVLILFTNQKCTGKLNIEAMPQLLLIYPENIEKYLSLAFAHRSLVDGPSENNYS
ncbi:hypothetical protein GLOIN_2v1805244 [Rhizophagus irregularis DAOM 181602=DAOM 197198]|nr:hypothetical protein GLOIN_2v1805244 [Rhizophagus irregularis DAOM 181602=DAOM 197198]